MLRARNQISLEVKTKIFADFDSGMKQSEVVRKYNLSQSTITTIVSKRKRVEDTLFGLDPSQKRILKTYFSSLPGVGEQHFHALDHLRRIRAQNYYMN